MLNFEKLKNRVNNANPLHFRGLVTEIIGLTIQSRGRVRELVSWYTFKANRVLFPLR